MKYFRNDGDLKIRKITVRTTISFAFQLCLQKDSNFFS
jgi:hypothetical protein